MIKIAILVNKAVDESNTIPILGFNNHFVEVPIADPDPTIFSVIINNTSFYLTTYISSYNIHYHF